MATAIDHLRSEHKYKQILVECGVSTTKDYYMSEDLDMPIDTLMLSIFGGEISKDCIGPVFPSL